LFWAAAYAQRRYTYSLMKMYFVTVFLFVIEEFVLSICHTFMVECLTDSLLHLEAYFTGFV